MQRFLDAGFELIESPSGEELTVQNVVERSGLSLRSFYHHFAGKHELLLALFEESIRMTADHLARRDGRGRRRRSIASGSSSPSTTGSASGPGPSTSDKRLPPRAIAKFAHQLLADHHEEAAEAFAPLVSLVRATPRRRRRRRRDPGRSRPPADRRAAPPDHHVPHVRSADRRAGRTPTTRPRAASCCGDSCSTGSPAGPGSIGARSGRRPGTRDERLTRPPSSWAGAAR